MGLSVQGSTVRQRFDANCYGFLKVPIDGPVPLMIDNEGMWFNVRNEGVSQRTRYWELWMHFVREMYLKLMLAPYKVDTQDERADILTKAMTKGSDDFAKFRNDIMNIGAAELNKAKGG